MKQFEDLFNHMKLEYQKAVHRVTASIGSKVEVPTNAGSAAKGVVYSAAFAASDTRPIAKKFVKMVKDKYGVVPGHDFSQMKIF